jgi:hypothetical protein
MIDTYESGFVVLERKLSAGRRNNVTIPEPTDEVAGIFEVSEREAGKGEVVRGG